MKVLFLQDNGLNESLLLTELSGVLRAAGHETAVLLEREELDWRGAIEAENPDLVLIPSSILAHVWVLKTARRVREWLPAVPQVLAGSHPTFYPDILERDGVDMILVRELTSGLAGRRPLETIRNLHFKRGDTIVRNELRPLVDLDSLPLPDRDLYFARYRFMRAFGWKKFTSGRGCFHKCAYCYQPSYRDMCSGLGRYVRRKSPGRVIDEVRTIADRYPLSNVHFSDDLFITNPRWLRSFAERYPAEVGRPFTINSSAEFVTAETAPLLAAAGCRAVAIGIETRDEALRMDILDKRIPTQTIRDAARAIRDAGMTLVTFNMIGSPGETLAQAIETMRFNAELGTDYARVAICFPIPDTPLARRAEEAGDLLDDVANDIYALSDSGDLGGRVYFRSAKPNERAFVNLYHLFNLGVSVPSMIPAIERAIRLPRNPLFELGRFHRMWKEKDIFHLSLLDAAYYFAHVGPPELRTSNFVSLL